MTSRNSLYNAPGKKVSESTPAGSFPDSVSCESPQERKKHINIKKTHRTPPNSDPLLKFFMWEPLLLENKAEEATHIKNLGVHWGPLHSLCGYFFMCFFRFLDSRDILHANIATLAPLQRAFLRDRGHNGGKLAGSKGSTTPKQLRESFL